MSHPNTIVGIQCLTTASCRSDLDTNSSFTLNLTRQLEGRGAGGGELWEEAQLSNPVATASIINITAPLSMHWDSFNKALTVFAVPHLPRPPVNGIRQPQHCPLHPEKSSSGSSSSYLSWTAWWLSSSWWIPQWKRNQWGGENDRADLVKYLFYFTSVFLTSRENGLFPMQKL